jgi:hypothetical protein
MMRISPGEMSRTFSASIRSKAQVSEATDVALGVAAQAAEDQRAEAVRIADGDQLVVGGEHQAVGAADLAERVDQALDEAAGAAAAMSWRMTSVSTARRRSRRPPRARRAAARR